MARILLAFFLLIASRAYAAIGEDVFEEAPGYTVHIRTVVEIPFAEDTRGSWIGAGFVVDAERGWVMTNAHISARSPSQVRISFRGGNHKPASKVYVDPYLDLAILELHESQRQNLKAARLDCGEFPPMGHPVGAFGHPWGLSYTGTRGIVSGATAKMGGELLQTDAPINSGNSGGPLISLETGEVVGINTSKYNDKKDQNTNFATPMKYACRVLELLRAGKDPSPPKLLTIFTKDLDDRGELIVGKSYLPQRVLAIRGGDRITGVVGVSGEIQNEGQLVHALRGRLNQFALEVIREGKEMTLSGQLQPVEPVLSRRGLYVSGVLLAPTGFRDEKELNLSQPLMVHSVAPGSLAESLGLKKWHMVVSVDGQAVDGLTDLRGRLADARKNKASVKVVFKRWTSGRDRIYEYIERTIPVEEFALIGSALNERVASLPEQRALR